MSEENQELEAVTDDEPVKDLSDWPSPGQKLKAIREEKGISHARVAQALHITAHYVNALEKNQFDKLPGKTFVKGYFKAYAKLLGADVESITTCYDQYMAKLEESEISEANVMRARKTNDQNLRWMICAALIIIVVVGVSWWLARGEEGDAGVSSVSAGNTNEQLEETLTRDNAAIAVSAIADENENRNISASGTSNSNNVRNNQQALSATANRNEPVTAEVLVARINGSENASGSEVADAVETTNNEDEPGTASETPVASSQAIAVAGNDSQVPASAESLSSAAITDADSPQQAREESVSELPEYSVTTLENQRIVSLESEGDDTLVVHFQGDSWVEVDNANSTRLYNDMLGSGDDLNIKGTAPFNVLFGDANVVEVIFNASEVDLSARIRSDNSARIILQPEN